MGRSVMIDYTQETPQPRADEILWTRLSFLDGTYFGYYFVSDEDFAKNVDRRSLSLATNTKEPICISTKKLLNHVRNIVNQWGTLPIDEDEEFEVKLMRAVMQLSACAADQKRALNGDAPIRPLDSYPDPLKFFS